MVYRGVFTRGQFRSPRAYLTPPRTPIRSRFRRSGVVAAAMGGAAAIGSSIYSRFANRRAAVASASRNLFPRRRRRRGGRVGRASGKYGSKRGRRSYNRKTAKVAKSSYTWIKELGFAQTDSTCINIGHCNMPVRKLKYAFQGAILRALLERMGCLPASPFDVPSYVSVGDKFKVYYSATWSTTTISVYQYVYESGHSLAKMTEKLNDALNTLMGDFNVSQFHIKYIAFEPVNTTLSTLSSTIINMTGASVTFTAKSSLKVQNRTDESTDNQDALTVDAVPLHGKMYWGNGTGTENRYSASIGTFEWVCGNENGVYNIAPGLNQGLQEPPPKATLPQVNKVASINLKPGDIKTSVLYSTFTHKVAKFFEKLPNMSNNADFVRSPFGKFCFISLEKLLEYENTRSSRKNISVVCELQTTLTCYLNYSERQYLSPENNVGGVIPE